MADAVTLADIAARICRPRPDTRGNLDGVTHLINRALEVFQVGVVFQVQKLLGQLIFEGVMVMIHVDDFINLNSLEAALSPHQLQFIIDLLPFHLQTTALRPFFRRVFGRLIPRLCDRFRWLLLHRGPRRIPRPDMRSLLLLSVGEDFYLWRVSRDRHAGHGGHRAAGVSLRLLLQHNSEHFELFFLYVP